MQEELRHVYEALTTKPISLLEAIAEDAPVGSSGRGAAVSAPRTPTTADGVSATMLSGGPHSRAPIPRLGLAAVGGVVLLIVLVAVAGSLHRHATADSHAEPSAEHVLASAPPVASPTVPPLPAVEPALAEQLIVPLERLPLASAAPPVQCREDLPKKRPDATAVARFFGRIAAPGRGAGSRRRPRRPADPYSARQAEPCRSRVGFTLGVACVLRSWLCHSG